MQTMSSASIVARTLLVLAGFFLLAYLCSACSVPVSLEAATSSCTFPGGPSAACGGDALEATCTNSSEPGGGKDFIAANGCTSKDGETFCCAGQPIAAPAPCGATEATACPETPRTCEVMQTEPNGDSAAPGNSFWLFEHGLAGSNPVPGDCVDLGDGWFECNADACLVLPYTGTCPHCGGGGE
jgi:hypothetical protein